MVTAAAAAGVVWGRLVAWPAPWVELNPEYSSGLPFAAEREEVGVGSCRPPRLDWCSAAAEEEGFAALC